jgi:hypothetical protein
MSATAAEMLEALKVAYAAKVSGGAVKSLSFPDGRNIVDMTLAELRTEIQFWEGRVLAEADSTRAPNIVRIQSIKLGSTP